MSKKHLLRLLAFCLCVFVFIPLSNAQEKGTPERIRITYATNSLAFLAMFVAKDRSFYAKHGLEVEVIGVWSS